MEEEQCLPREQTIFVTLVEDAETEAAVVEDAVARAVLAEAVPDAATAQKVRNQTLLLQLRRKRNASSLSLVGAVVNKVTDCATVPRTMDLRMVMAKNTRRDSEL